MTKDFVDRQSRIFAVILEKYFKKILQSMAAKDMSSGAIVVSESV